LSSSSTLIAQLRSSFDGRVTGPGDAGYDQARKVFYGKWDRRPAAVVRPTSAEEVARVVTLAAESGSELAVRSGGHSLAGHSVSDGGIVLDLAELTALDIDLESRTAWAQTGLTAGAYTARVGEHGLTIDSLLAAELVTADGQVLEVDDEHHPDLFWAIRGGGGNFGVATRFRFRLHELPSIVGGMLLLPGSPEVIEGLVAAAAAAPEELSLIANVMVAPPIPFIPASAHGQLVVMALLAYAGDAEAGERALAPIRALAEPLADMVQPMPYAGLFQGGGDDMEVVEESARSLFCDTVDATAAKAVIEHLQASTAPMAVAQLRVLGGAMARVPVEATAFAHRHRPMMAGVGCVYEQAADRPAHDAWADEFAAALRQGDPGVYVNFLGDEGPARVREAYPGPTWDRLVEVKRRWDPDNLFLHNQNIPPDPA